MKRDFVRARPDPVVRASGLARVTFARPSLRRAARFLRAFGMVQLEGDETYGLFGSPRYGEGFYVVRRDRRPRFVGLALYVEAERDLQALIDHGASPTPEPLRDPNGRPFVRLTDPSGVEVAAVVRGAAETTASRARSIEARVNRPFVAEGAVPPVLRLGHVVMETTEFERTVAWYQRIFGLIVSDHQDLPDGTPVVAFCRFDRGDRPTDHHSIAIGRGFRDSFDHVAFEVDDIEAVTRGQHTMMDHGYRHAWGVGRHIMGSQVFDYWYDDFGAKHEHYADGDLVTSSHPMGSSPFGPSFLAQWGPPMPPAFIGGAPSPQALVDLMKFAASRRMPLRRLAAMIKAAKLSSRRVHPPVHEVQRSA